jgi:hypothetical protein
VLAKRDYLDGTARYPVTGSDLEVIVPTDTVAVVVKDISGTVVIPASGSKSSAQIPLYSVDDAKTASIDLGNLPYDLYTIAVQTSATARLVTRMFRTAKRAQVGDDTLSENALVAPRYPWRAAFVPSASAPMVMLDILLTNPTPDASGFFPLTSLFAASGPANFSSNSSYVLPFDARATYWEYYIVSRDPAAHLTDLRIEPLTRDDVKFRQVSNPKPLPDGAIPIVMRSTNKLPLRQLPPQRFRLTARRTGPAGQSNDIVVNPLPVAPGAPVWPGPKAQPRSGTSEMFVYV